MLWLNSRVTNLTFIRCASRVDCRMNLNMRQSRLLPVVHIRIIGRESFFEPEGYKVGPLIYDGGTSELINPYWGSSGHTDFIQRLAVLYLRDYDIIKALSDNEKINMYMDDSGLADKYYFEGCERKRILLESRAYQRLALALYAKLRYTPGSMPETMRARLSWHWETFKGTVDILLHDYKAHKVAEAIWLKPETRYMDYPEWILKADYEPIKKGLIELEAARREPEMRKRAINLLYNITNAIDCEIGLKYEKGELSGFDVAGSPLEDEGKRRCPYFL